MCSSQDSISWQSRRLSSSSQAPAQAKLLADHIATVRSDLTRGIDQMLGLIAERTEAFQGQALSKVDLEVTELRAENDNLRSELSSCRAYTKEQGTGGTGDTAPPGGVSQLSSGERSSVFAGPYSDDEENVSNDDITYEQLQPVQPEIEGDEDGSRPSVTAIRSRNSLRISASANAETASWKPSVHLPPDLPDNPAPPEDGPPELSPEDSAERAALKRSRLKNLRSRTVNSLSFSRARDKEHRIWPSTHEHALDVWSAQDSQNAVQKVRSVKSEAGQGGLGWLGHRAKIFGSAARYRNEPNRDSLLNREAQPVFADVCAMKDRVRAAVTKHEYNVGDFYYDHGYPQLIARSQYFEWITLFVIAFNAIWLAIDADKNDKDVLLEADPIFQIAEHFFCAYFTFEWIVRLLAFRMKRDGLKDAWFCFDTCLVFLMIMETWVLNLFVFGIIYRGGVSSNFGNANVLKLIRLVRLTRMARMAKLLHAVPELIILIKGITVAARTVFFTLLLLAIIIYFFAIIFRQLTSGSEVGERYFGSVPAAMATLLLDGVIPDQAHLVESSGTSHLFLAGLGLLFILLASLTVMNMLVGVLCEVVSVVSAVEKEQLLVNYVKHKLLKMFDESQVDADGNKCISRKEFESLLENKEAAQIIQDMGVDVVGLVDFADIIFEDDIELGFADFMELVLQLRGTNTCTVKDIVDLRKFIVTELNSLTNKIAEFFPDNNAPTKSIAMSSSSSLRPSDVTRWGASLLTRTKTSTLC